MAHPRTPSPRFSALARSLVLSLAVCAPLPLWAAGVSVPELSLLTHGSAEGDLFTLKSRVYLDMAFEGGSKFLGSVKLNISSRDFEGDYALMDAESLALIFKSASVTIRGEQESPVEATWFIGALDTLCSGAEYPQLFGTPRVATHIRGFMYSPDGIGGDERLSYDGIHAVSGTGLKLAIKAMNLHTAIYAYQDLMAGPGLYSGDLRFLLNTRIFKMDAFMGVTGGPGSLYGLYRAGALLFFKAGELGAFLLEAGLPRFDPGNLDDFDLEQFFFLAEIRAKVGAFSFTPTLFYHPAWYLHRETGEAGTLDLNFTLTFGDIESGGKVQGGAETMLSWDPLAASSPLSITVSPYLTTSLGGAIWDAKVGFDIFPIDESRFLDTIEVYIGAKTGF